MNRYSEYVLTQPHDMRQQRHVEQDDTSNPALPQQIKVLQHENTTLRAEMDELRSITRDMKPQSINSELQHRSFKKRAEAMVVRREAVNRAIYCERHKMDCSRITGINISGCGGDGVENNNIQQRESMCTQFEIFHHDWVVQRDKSNMEMHSRMQHLLNNNLNHAYDGPDVPYRSPSGELLY